MLLCEKRYCWSDATDAASSEPSSAKITVLVGVLKSGFFMPKNSSVSVAKSAQIAKKVFLLNAKLANRFSFSVTLIINE